MQQTIRTAAPAKGGQEWVMRVAAGRSLGQVVLLLPGYGRGIAALHRSARACGSGRARPELVAGGPAHQRNQSHCVVDVGDDLVVLEVQSDDPARHMPSRGNQSGFAACPMCRPALGARADNARAVTILPARIPPVANIPGQVAAWAARYLTQPVPLGMTVQTDRYRALARSAGRGPRAAHSS